MKSILITGGAGYIGSHTVRELLNRKYKVIVVDNLSNGHREALIYQNVGLDSLIEFYQIDVRDRESMRSVFKKHNISAVIHLAGLAIVEESFYREAEYLDHNLNATVVVLNLCREFGIRNFIFSSSSTIYGNVNGPEKLTEKHKTEPINPYGQSKLLCEQKIKEFAPWVHAICLRYFNVAGASTDLSNGPCGNGSGRLIFNVTKAATQFMRSEQLEQDQHQQKELMGRIIVNGRDYATEDGTCVRDYIHVEDIADIHARALEYLFGQSGSSTQSWPIILNCGYGYGYSVQQIIESYKKTNEVEFDIEWGPRRLGDPAYLVADNTKLVNLLGWKSRFSNPLEAICKSAYQWNQKNQKLN